MTTALSVKLVRGAAVLDLNSAPYEIAEGFTPPAALVRMQIAAGTSANRFGGGTVTGRKATDRGFSFGLHVGTGAAATTAALIEGAARRLQFMLDQAGDPDTPLYLVFRSTTDTTLVPLWGQAALWYEVSFGLATLSGIYSVSDMRARALPNCAVSLTLKPYALGTAQLVATATGGILPDQWGTPDGSERGLMVLEATPSAGNYFDNPVYGAATWNTGWSTGTNIIASQNTNPAFCLPQTLSSALVQSAAATLNTYTESLTAANTNTYTLSAYVMRPDSAAVTSADVDLIYNAVALTTSYLNLGNGLYKLEGTFTGIASAKATGIRVKSGHSVYLLGSQMEEKAYSTPLCWGDLLGCAWAGTAHASKSTRTVASVKVATDDTVLRAAQGSVAITVVPTVSSATVARDCYLFSFGTTNMRATWQNSALAWIFIDPTNSNQATSSATSFTAGVPVVLHITWGPSGSFIYVNGVQAATNATYAVTNLGANLFIGSSSVVNGNWPGTVADFRTFATALTAAEVSADYANTSLVSGATVDVCQRVGAIPWEWSNGGDNVFSPGTGVVSSVQKYNWGVFGGVPGSAPATVELKLTSSATISNTGGIWFSRMLTPFFFDPAQIQFVDLNVQVDTGASIGDLNLPQAVNTSDVDTGWTFGSGIKAYRLLQGKEYYLFMRLKDAGANLTAASELLVSAGGQVLSTDYLALAADASMRLFKTLPQNVPYVTTLFSDRTIGLVPVFAVGLKRSAAGSANVTMDFFAIMPRPLTQIAFPYGSGNSVIYVKNDKAKIGTATLYTEVAQVQGDIFVLEPGGYNQVMLLLSSIGGLSVVTQSLTVTSALVTPRYALL